MVNPNTPDRHSRPPSIIGSSRTARALAAVRHETNVRRTRVLAEGLVQTTKAQEIDMVTREAMCGQAFLQRYAIALAGADPFLAEDLRFFTEMAKLGKGEVIADLVSTYCRESYG